MKSTDFYFLLSTRMVSRFLALCTLALLPLSSHAAGIIFPMTLWGSLHINDNPVPAGAKVQFYDATGSLLGELTTTKVGQYGGNSVYDANVALSSFEGKLSIVVNVDDETYVVSSEDIDDTQKGINCPEKESITFTSKSCRYDIAIDVPSCTPEDWMLSSWSNCTNGNQTRTATKKRNCDGGTRHTLSRSCIEHKPSIVSTGESNRQNNREEVLPPALVQTGKEEVHEENTKESEALPAEGESSKPEDSSAINPKFKDMKDHWAESYVHMLTQQGVLRNQEWFRPDEEVNRAEFLKSILEAFAIPPEEANMRFRDVPHDAWYSPYVQTAYALGIVEGYSDKTFRAAQSINRAEGLKILFVSAGIQNPDGFVPFSDVPTDAWFAGIVGYAFEHGIVQGVTDTRFKPDAKLTRAQMAKIIYLFLLLSPHAS